MKLKDLPEYYLPREKALKYGLDSLSDVELLAIILRTGTKEKNVIQLANDLLMQVGGLSGLLRTNYQSLKSINGIKNAKALSLASIVNIYQRIDMDKKVTLELTIDKILERYEKVVITNKQELMIIVILDRRGVIFKESIIGKGNDAGVPFYYREIFKEVYLNNGYGFYLIHTHPDDVAYPSHRDLRITEELQKRAKRLGLHFKDHFIVGTDGFTSIFDFLKKKLN